MKNISEIEACAELSGRVSYDGDNLYWKAANKRALNGALCGRKGSQGHRRINSTRYGTVQVHRLIFFLLHGFLPPIVDHRDGDSSNNRWDNLRAATIAENTRNSKTSCKNTSGRKGVYFHKATGKWQASIRAGGPLMHLGIFDSFDDAVKAREIAEDKYHAEFKRH